jgi:two-component system cell cycle response regulator DivK
VSALSTPRSAVVLLVQPERDDRDMYVAFLHHVGMTPIIVSDVAPALVLAADSDVIVTELLLPGSMDGIEFIARLRRDRPTNGVPIIVLTSSAWDTERERAQRAGCDTFLSKPCSPDRLLHEIRQLFAISATWTGRRHQAHANLPIEPHPRRHPKRTG